MTSPLDATVSESEETVTKNVLVWGGDVTSRTLDGLPCLGLGHDAFKVVVHERRVMSICECCGSGMPSSELSNALNPYANQPRPRPAYPVPYDTLQPQQPPPYVPHRSELELAVSEPPPPPPRQPNPASIQAVQELLRFVASTRDAQEAERTRRLQWEREQEAKYAQQQAQMERKLQQLTQEVITLRASNNAHPTPPSSSGLLTPQQILSPSLAIQQPPQLATPTSPVSHSSYPYPAFVQGSSNQQQVYDNRFHASPHPEPSVSAVTPSPSPHLNFVQPNQEPQNLSVPSSHGKKRQSSELSSDGEASSSESSSTSNHRVKRINHHDTRCLTIHVCNITLSSFLLSLCPIARHASAHFAHDED